MFALPDWGLLLSHTSAWHFHYALRLVINVVCGSFGTALLTS
ncbi:hypothetical protein CGI80_11405 [Vibrio parahaemolyticus]|nr:hypothetical protein CGI80_11405 [Vibrio parahaemolyticus]